MARERNVAAFVARHRQAWERLDLLAGTIGRRPLTLGEVEELDRLYRRAVGDLAWARSAFPGSDVAGYLAQLTARAFGLLHRRRRGAAALRDLLRDGIPGAFSRARPAFLLAAALLAAGAGAGALALALDPAAAALLVPEGIREAVAARRVWTDDLLAVAPGLGGSAIARNNLTVAALAFAGGLSGGIATAAILVANGLVLGAVAVHAAQAGQGGPLLSFVAAHGPPELLALLLSAQGGFWLAAALLRPGESPRGALLAVHGRDGARLLAAALPLLVLVAVVEASISPGAAWGAGLKGAIGGGLAAAVLAWLWRGSGR